MSEPGAQKRHRLFIALPLSSDVERALGQIIDDLSVAGARVKWVDPRNIHMTVRFLGDTDERLIPDLKKLIDRVVSHTRSARVSISRLGAFPNLKKPRVFWAGLDQETPLEGIVAMAEEIERGVQALGFEPESKSFKPHLTLARVKYPDGLDPLCRAVHDYTVTPIDVSLDRLVLFKSTLTPQGPVYDRLHESVLGAERFE
ncbi:RNA 2',3'-cyclic phosphodiesterase [bacterium]|nr:RNA 2',3'-cyclic phosphodiesterase [bacterium]